MERKEILLQLNHVFREIFDNEELVICEDTTASDIKEWDSLEHINLIMACEKKFGLKFDISEIGKMKNVKDIILMIEEKSGSLE